MNRIFGKAKEKVPPPNLTDVISGVSDWASIYSQFSMIIIITFWLTSTSVIGG